MRISKDEWALAANRSMTNSTADLMPAFAIAFIAAAFMGDWAYLIDCAYTCMAVALFAWGIFYWMAREDEIKGALRSGGALKSGATSSAI